MSNNYEENKGISEIEMKYREERHKSLMLAEEIERLRKLVDVKDEVLKYLSRLSRNWRLSMTS